MTQIYGYIRTSRRLQEGVPWENLFRDIGVSGSTGTQERRGWHRLDNRLAGGDTLVVAIDRIGRTWQDTVRSICALRDRGVKIRSLAVANLAGRLSAETVNALANESGGPVGRLLGIPVDGADATVEGLKTDIANLRGKMALLETGDWGNSGDARVDLKSERFGAEPPAPLVELLSASSQEVYSACGFNSALWGGSSSGVREAWRLALFGALSPLGRLVESEFKARLDEEISLSWQELRASDLSGRARAFQSMVGGGMPVDQAVAVAGLMVED